MSERPLVLIVEDNLTEQKLLSLLLDKFGYRVKVAACGSDALEAIADPDLEIALILMDWQMDDMDGLECTRRIRAAQEKSGIFVPIVAVTARVMLGDKQKCLQSGMNDYLSKPFTVKQFEQTVARWTECSSAMTG